MLNQLIKDFTASAPHTSPLLLVVTMLICFLLGAVIVYTSKKLSFSATIDPNFNKSLLLLPALIAAIIYFIGSSLALSIGLIGSLSIVRFRTAIKNPFELILLLWAIMIGIGAGSGNLVATVIFSFFTHIFVVLTEKLDFVGHRNKTANVFFFVSSVSDLGEELEALLAEITNDSFKISSNTKDGKNYSYSFEIYAIKKSDLIKELRPFLNKSKDIESYQFVGN